MINGADDPRGASSRDWAGALRRLDKEPVRNCILCGSRTSEHDARWQAYLALPAEYGVARCRSCDLRWLDPRPSAAGYRVLYSDENYFGGAGASPVEYQHVMVSRRDYFERRLRGIERSRGITSGLSILDYGAAAGDFVALARARGHHCDGIELSADARGQSESLHGVRLMSAEEGDALPDASYDVLHMNHVLEHMADPLAHLRWCSRVLKLGGLLVAEVPQQFENDLDRLRRLFHLGGKQRQFDAYSLHHTYFFTPASLPALAVRAGFSVFHLRTFNADKTPLWPPVLRNWVLRFGLSLADRLHSGGNILELHAVNGRAVAEA